MIFHQILSLYYLKSYLQYNSSHARISFISFQNIIPRTDTLEFGIKNICITYVFDSKNEMENGKCKGQKLEILDKCCFITSKN